MSEKKWFRDNFGRVYQALISNDPEIATPTQRFNFYAAESLVIEMTPILKGTLLGTGTVTKDAPPPVIEFTPAEGFSPALLGVGRIQARLQDGRITAVPVEDEAIGVP